MTPELYSKENRLDKSPTRPYRLLQFQFNEKRLRDKLSDWSCLQSDVPREDANDCVINTLHFLEVIKNREISEQFAKIANAGNIPTLDKVLELMFTFLDGKHNSSKYSPPFDSWIHILREQLSPKYATLVLLERDPPPGHAVIAYKDGDNTLYIFDPQQSMVYTEDKLQEYFLENEYSKLSLIYKSPKRLLFTTKTAIRKDKETVIHPSKRTRRTPIPISPTGVLTKRKLESPIHSNPTSPTRKTKKFRFTPRLAKLLLTRPTKPNQTSPVSPTILHPEDSRK
jgi:hypothetical protein